MSKTFHASVVQGEDYKRLITIRQNGEIVDMTEATAELHIGGKMFASDDDDSRLILDDCGWALWLTDEDTSSFLPGVYPWQFWWSKDDTTLAEWSEGALTVVRQLQEEETE